MNGGGKYKAWYIPFFTWEHVRHDVECNIGKGNVYNLKMLPYDSLMKNGEKYIPLKENQYVNKYRYNYLDKYDNTSIPCTFWVEEREWRRKWFTWCNLKWFKKVDRYIEIEFEKEVGRRKL